MPPPKPNLIALGLRRTYVTTTTITAADIAGARRYCLDQLRKSDYSAYLLRSCLPADHHRDVYDILRTLNLELVRIPENVSSPTMGAMRMQFWRDAVKDTFAGRPPKEPIMVLLHLVLTRLQNGGAAQHGSSNSSSIKFWLLRLIDTREKYMDNRPFPTLAALENYAENTYATLMYVTLALLPVCNTHVDHLASHIGKACGIVAVLRGVPVLAASAAPSVRSPSGVDVGAARRPSLLLPLDVMAEAGLKEEDVYRQGPQANGFQDAVFKVATRANDHLITAREMLKSIRAGRGPGHEYEHQGEEEHRYSDATAAAAAAAGGGSGGGGAGDAAQERDVARSFGVLMEAVPTGEYLERLERADFNPFAVGASWKLPWRIWRASSTRQI